MKRLRLTVSVAIFLTAITGTKAQDFKQRYVGKNPCAPSLQSEYSDFSLRLHKAQRLELVARYWDKAQIVLIIQSKVPSDGCGVIRDVVQITDQNTFDQTAKHFEFRCFDSLAPTDVVVGAVVRGYGNVKLVTAMDAWRIDLKERKFLQTHDRVVCSADGFGGDDDGSDLVDAAKQYAAHHKPGQFASEQAALPKDTPVTPITRVTIEGRLIEGVHLNIQRRR